MLAQTRQISTDISRESTTPHALLRNHKGHWRLLDGESSIERVSGYQLQNVVHKLNLDKLVEGQSGLSIFNESNGKAYRFVKINADTIQISEETTSRYLQQYLADREALFSKFQSISVGEMAATLAHEINQPVGAIQNLMQGIDARLRRDALSEEDLRGAVARGLDQTQYAARIISRIRDFTQERQPEHISVSVCPLLKDSVRLLDWVFTTRNVEVFVDCQQELQVTGDYTMLQQVVVNLLRNSIEAVEAVDTPEHTGEIRVKVQANERTVSIEIHDNGIGIENPQQLFTAFMTTKANGMGVGLNICRSFIELHQGRLWLSKGEPNGTIAHVHLPLREDENAK